MIVDSWLKRPFDNERFSSSSRPSTDTPNQDQFRKRHYGENKMAMVTGTKALRLAERLTGFLAESRALRQSQERYVRSHFRYARRAQR